MCQSVTAELPESFVFCLQSLFGSIKAQFNRAFVEMFVVLRLSSRDAFCQPLVFLIHAAVSERHGPPFQAHLDCLKLAGWRSSTTSTPTIRRSTCRSRRSFRRERATATSSSSSRSSTSSSTWVFARALIGLAVLESPTWLSALIFQLSLVFAQLPMGLVLNDCLHKTDHILCNVKKCGKDASLPPCTPSALTHGDSRTPPRLTAVSLRASSIVHF